ncbi:hypothetical protein QFC22_005327 [Naganishia vaughanmartiniae]|uniref:Uncharacterized protein n=1 Tax=Naganishia vaughanmartiniae TaxID=1424756 RepID=A0ACC2WTA8_9TREE|nr:hypothetical protein QFC22_005327 [Naganishia vaughanmartiniae]
MQPIVIQPLLVDPFLQRDLLDFGTPASHETPQETNNKVYISCAVGYSNNLYVGSNDGQILWYTLDSSSRSNVSSSDSNSKSSAFVLRNKHVLSGRKAVDKILLAPKVGKAIILSDSTLSFLTLPTLESLTVNPILPIRNVSHVTLDDQEIAWKAGEEEMVVSGAGVKGLDIGMCTVKRKAIGLYRLGAKLSFLRDVPVPETPTQAVRSNATLCISDHSNYCIVDLLGSHLLEILPISQAPPDAPADVNPAIAVLPGEPEFLFASFTGAESGSMGVFINKDGDPVRGTMSWSSHPRSIVIEGDSVIALCRDNSLRIHSISNITSGIDEPPQQLSLASKSAEDGLESPAILSGISINPYGLTVPDPKRDRLIRPVLRKLMSGTIREEAAEEETFAQEEVQNSPSSDEARRWNDADVFSPSAMSESTAPSGSNQGILHKLPGFSPSVTVNETLVWTSDTVYVLASDSWVIRANELLSENSPGASDKAAKMVEEERKKAKRGEVDGDKAAHTAELRFMVIVSEEQDRPSFRNVPLSEVLNKKISEIYGTDVGSDRESPSEEIKQISDQLQDHAKRMLSEYLRKTRHSRRKTSASGNSVSTGKDMNRERSVDQAIDTCLCKLLAEQNESEELLGILQSNHDCLLEELELFIDAERQPGLLARVLTMIGKHTRVLEVVTSMVDKGIQSSEIPEPTKLVESILRQSNDVAMIRKYGLWLAKSDPETALQVLTGQRTVISVKFDDRALLSDLQAINPEAANKYLEYAIVRKRSADKSLHNALLAYYLEECEKFLSDDGVLYHFTEIYDEYVATRPGVTYCQYIAETAHDSPAKTLRMKTILFLQGSPFYDVVEAEERLQGIDKLFYEKAIVYGRLGRHERALQLLAIHMRDSVSAETYCSQGGVVVPPKIARTIGKKMPELEPWVALGEVGRRRKGTIEGEQRENLVMALLKVYMEDGSRAKKQTRDLLNAQALHLDTIQVIDMIPPDWSVSSMSDFFTRAMKRQLHEKATWRIIKSISAGQNSAIAEEYARTVGKQPPIIEAGPATSPSGYTLPDEGSIAATEYGSMLEKSPQHRSRSEDDSEVSHIGTGEKVDQPKNEESGAPPATIDLTGAADFMYRPRS